MVSIDSLKDKFPNVFRESLGCLKEFKVKIRFREGAQPSCAKVRSVPLAVKQEMEKELQKLKEGGIMEEVESTDWLAPVVAAWKSSGALRLCVDLRQLNKCRCGSLSTA